MPLDALNLANGKSAYGKGSWASSIRYYNGTYCVSTFALETGIGWAGGSRSNYPLLESEYPFVSNDVWQHRQILGGEAWAGWRRMEGDAGLSLSPIQSAEYDVRRMSLGFRIS